MTGQNIITVENLSAYLLVIWGAVCLNPYDDLFANNLALYGPMAAFAPEWFWGLVFFTCGLLGFYLSYSGRRVRTAQLMFVVYTAFAIMFGMGDLSQPGWLYYGSLALANLIIQGAAGAKKWKTQP